MKAIIAPDSHKKQNYYKILCELMPELSNTPTCQKVNSKSQQTLEAIIIDSKKTFK